LCLIAFLPLVALAAPPSDGCAEFNARLERTYGFRPSQLDDASREAKSKGMDAVWEAVHQDPATLVPCLRAALARPTQDQWFLFDGGQLLVSMDSSREAKLVLLDALTKVSLDDVDLRSWVGIASTLGNEGFDTSALGRRWLFYPEAEYSLPEHGGYRVDRGNGAMFIFGALEEKYATPALIELSRTASGSAKEIAVSLLMSQATPEALQALVGLNTSDLSAEALASRQALLQKPALIVRRKSPKTTRAQFVAAFAAILADNEQPFNDLVEAVPDGERDVVTVCTTVADLDMIRRVRRHFIAKNNQHAIDFYNQFSQIIMTLVWKPELVRAADAKVAVAH